LPRSFCGCRSSFFSESEGDAIPTLPASSVWLEHDGVKLNRRPSPAHLAPLAGRGRIASAMPTGRANARPMTGSASSGAIRVRGSHRAHLCSEFAEAAPHPNPLRASFARLDPAKSGERET
jgi:hypothetical protein